jgi:predicted enzyme related to lactoylglutathione lyase
MNVSGIDATYYTVSDAEGMKQFYSDLFGGPPAFEMPGRLAEWTFADGNAFGIYRTEGKIETRSGSAMFAVDDVAKAVETAKARGVKFHDGGEVTDTPVCHMAFGEDPEGNQFILHHRK